LVFANNIVLVFFIIKAKIRATTTILDRITIKIKA